MQPQVQSLYDNMRNRSTKQYLRIVQNFVQSYLYNSKIFKEKLQKKLDKLVFLQNLWPKAMILCKELFFIGALYEGKSVGGILYNGEAIFLGSFEGRKPQGGHLNQSYWQENLFVLKISKCKKNQNTYFWRVSFYLLFIFYTLGVFLNLIFGV